MAVLNWVSGDGFRVKLNFHFIYGVLVYLYNAILVMVLNVS